MSSLRRRVSDGRRRLGTADLLNSNTRRCLLFCLLLLTFDIWSSSTSCTTDGSGSTTRGFPNAFACAAGVAAEKKEEPIDTEDLSRIRQGGNGGIKKRKAFFPAAAADEVSGKSLSLNEILYKAGKRSLGGGFSGAIAGAVQVVSLMWLRTIINYQCRYGTTFSQALGTLMRDGGIARLYRGVVFALVQAPLARFVSVAANDGIESLLSNISWTKDWGPGKTTVVASIVVGFWRILLMPIDTMKTVLQVDSAEGFRSLMRRVRRGKFGVLYEGALANAVAAILGHYPWFFTFNLLSASDRIKTAIPSQLLRNAGIGIASSIVSDTVVNAMRVIKTTKQSLASKQSASYSDTVKVILAADGWRGLFGRGLRTRIFANALQSIVFTVVWRGIRDHWAHKSEQRQSTKDGKENDAQLQ